MVEHTCIYCKAQATPFTREHVIQQAFGTFEQNLVLHDCVCAKCNSYFSRELDFHLSRDSAEALLRLRRGLKPVSEARELLNQRVKLRIREQGPWYDARFIDVPDATDTRLETEFVPQVAFRKTSQDKWVWIEEDELQNPEVVEPFRKDSKVKIVGPSDDAIHRLRHRLEQLGINIRQQGVLNEPIADGPIIQAKVECRMDEVIFRGIAKIAFNYVAYIRGAGFVLRPVFDPIRRFVRYGEDPGWLQVFATDMPILAGDTRSWRQTTGHLVVFDWNRGREGLVVLVSLFNNITYHVLICKKYDDVWFPLDCGHHFDLENRTISPVTGTKLIRPPW